MERELLLLGLLHRFAMHGYQLNEFIERDLSICTDLKKPTAYFLLDKMAKLGWITQHEEQEGKRPARRVYRITGEGEAQFQKLIRENLAVYDPARFSDDVGLAFADALSSEEALALLGQKRVALLAELEAARSIPPHGGSLQLIIDHRRFHLESELRWLDEVIVRFQKVSAPESGTGG